jgi:hypothetical protein
LRRRKGRSLAEQEQEPLAKAAAAVAADLETEVVRAEEWEAAKEADTALPAARVEAVDSAVAAGMEAALERVTGRRAVAPALVTARRVVALEPEAERARADWGLARAREVERARAQE